MNTDQGEVQLGPNEVNSPLSSLFRCCWSSETAPLVIAGLTTDAANAGPPVVFTICKSAHCHSLHHRERGGEGGRLIKEAL